MFAQENKSRSACFVVALLIFFFSNSVQAQSFLNGSFETNTVSVDQINMTNAAFNAAMSNTFAFGSYGDMDIITSSTWGPPQSGSWYTALTGGGTDIITLKLSSPLVIGNTYTISFYDRGNASFPTYPVRLGLSTVNSAVGTTIYTGPTPSYGVWSQRSFTFTAPNSGQYISVTMTAGSLGDWVNVDNFRFVTTLPVELLSFKADAAPSKVTLHWSTASEINNDYFEIERSADGKKFEIIGNVKGAGNSSHVIEYIYKDAFAVNGLNYYRLKQVDYDGKFTFSEIIAVQMKRDAEWTFVSNENSFTFISPKQASGIIVMTDTDGRIIQTRNFSNENSVSLSAAGCAAGIYFARISADSFTKTFRLIKN